MIIASGLYQLIEQGSTYVHVYIDMYMYTYL